MRIPVTEKKRVEAFKNSYNNNHDAATELFLARKYKEENGSGAVLTFPEEDINNSYMPSDMVADTESIERTVDKYYGGAKYEIIDLDDYITELEAIVGDSPMPTEPVELSPTNQTSDFNVTYAKKQAAKFPNLFSADTIKWIELETQLIAANNYGVPASIDQANAFIDKAKDEVVDIISKAVSGEVTRVINASKEDLLESMMEDIEAAMQSAQQGGVPVAQPQPQAPTPAPQAPMSASLKKAFGEEKNKPEPDSSISHGTMREEDLIPTFLDELEMYAPEKAQAIIDEFHYDREAPESFDFQSEEASFMLNEALFDALNEIAPEGCYFGSHPGDGSDYGFWKVEEELDEEAGGDWIGSANPVK